MGKYRFISPLRCLDCRTRFVAKTFVPSDFIYASCPRCGRMDLNSWSPAVHTPRAWVDFKVKLGAKRLRCEYCRLNFASFRSVKEPFSFDRWTKKGVGNVVAEGRARFAEEQMKAMEQHQAEQLDAQRQQRLAEKKAEAEEAAEEAEWAEEMETRSRKSLLGKVEKKLLGAKSPGSSDAAAAPRREPRRVLVANLIADQPATVDMDTGEESDGSSGNGNAPPPSPQEVEKNLWRL